MSWRLPGLKNTPIDKGVDFLPSLWHNQSNKLEKL
jgi:hypothetical protein